MEQIPWGTTGVVVLGLLGVLSASLLVMRNIQAGKEVFGRTPPVSDEMKAVESRLSDQMAQLRREDQTMDLKIIQLRQDMDVKFTEMNLQRSRNVAELHNEIRKLSTKLAFLDGYISQKKKEEGAA